MANLTPSNPTLRQLRHDLRGRINAMQLCISALPVAADKNEAIEFVDDVINLCDKINEVVEQIQQVAATENPA